jgi:hypothetical protein
MANRFSQFNESELTLMLGSLRMIKIFSEADDEMYERLISEIQAEIQQQETKQNVTREEIVKLLEKAYLLGIKNYAPTFKSK